MVENGKNPAHRIMVLHGRVAYLAGMALLAPGCDKIAIELAEVRTELSEIFDLLRPQENDALPKPHGH